MSLPRDAAALAAHLGERGRPGASMVGLEVELGILDREGRPVPYADVRRLLEAIQAQAGEGLNTWEPIYEGEHVIALSGSLGDQVTLEPGGQIELSTRPGVSAAENAAAAAQELAVMAGAAESCGLQLIGGGLQFASLDDVHWMPKGRYSIMREWFASLGPAGRLAHTMMKRTLSLQVSLDYGTPQNAEELLRLSFRAAPVATAIWAASPWHHGTESEEDAFSSYRAEAWRFTDPSRQGLIPTLLDPQEPDAALRAYVDHVLASPMMFRISGSDYLPMRGASFADVLSAQAWPDASPLSEKDIWDHFGSIFTDARLKPGLIELRSTDGPVLGDSRARSLAEVPAFWVGLAYDDASRAAALELLGGISSEEHQACHARVPREGLQAPWGSSELRSLALELVGLAKAGVERLIEAGREGPLALEAISAVQERLAQGRVPSDELREALASSGREGVLDLLRV